MERTLALIAGAGALPARAAAEARRQGWRVLAFAFDAADGLEKSVDVFVPSALDDVQGLFQRLVLEQASAALFVGKFWKREVIERAGVIDEAAMRLASGGLSDTALAQMVVSVLESMSIEVLDQRPFLSEWLAAPGTLSAREPTEEEWAEIRSGLALARQLSSHGIGQTVVRFMGLTVAVEAVEGTDETIRRGLRLTGRGGVVVKGIADGHDYRFDVPAIGPTTLDAMIEGRATALAIVAGSMLIVDREEVIRMADEAGIAVVSVAADA